MKILVIGSGGREHALIWKIKQSALVDKIFCAPGNGGIAQDAECIEIKAEDISALLDFAKKEKIDLTVVGPEAPLAEGIVDEFSKYNLHIFGPTKRAAQIEASKVFAKELMARYKVPTANFKIFDEPDVIKRYIQENGTPCVVKADGLAQGKGVVVAKTEDEAASAVDSIMQKKIFGEAGKRVIIEDCLEGEEASILVFTDSRAVVPLATSQDHKRALDDDKGSNTGGMGAYSPAPVVTATLFKGILDTIIYRTLNGLLKEGIVYKGVLYAGIMLTEEGPKVLEFNVRFGDPEIQAILPRLNADIVELMLATVNGRLNNFKKLVWDGRSCVCVVLASGGYPGSYQRGKEISGLDKLRDAKDIFIFHAGTQRIPNTEHRIPIFVTNGGRVLNVAALGKDIKEAQAKVYAAIKNIHFEQMHYRKDIGNKALRFLN